MNIGICDDNDEVRQSIFDLCKEISKEENEIHSCIVFKCGEEVLNYCKQKDSLKIDILFLDIEMPGIDGIELKNLLTKQDLVWRIAFVSSHLESTFDAFGTKTIGFVPKPPTYDKIKKMIYITQDELNENVTFLCSGYNGEVIEVEIDDIAYLQADGSYTMIHTYSSLYGNHNYILSAKKLGVLEKEMRELPIIRVHKSYLVNIGNVLDISNYVILRDINEKIPVGRMYKESAKLKFYNYGKNRIRKRL